MPSSSVEPDNGVATAALVASTPAVDERLVSSLRTQAKVEFLCTKHGVPSAYTPRHAGDDRRACTPPPPGYICVYAHALEAGMRLPLHGFVCEVLLHFGIAPAQLMPNGWRVMAGFLALSRSVGVPPSLGVFRRFFVLSTVSHKLKGWYCFRARDSSGLRFTGMPNTPLDWKRLYFFLSSPEPWPCPVEWGEPSKSSFADPALTSEEKRSAKKILEAYGGAGAAVDIKTCLCDGNLAGPMLTAASPPLPAAASPYTSKGMDPSVYNMMRTMFAERASTKKVKAEPGSNAPGSPALCGKKRGLEEGNDKECSAPSLLNTALSSGVFPPPPGFQPRKPRTNFPRRHGGDTTDWKAARELLQAAGAPAQQRVFSASEPSEVVRSSYAAILKAVNYTSFSLSYALELEEKLVARDAEVAALRKQLEEAKAEVAAVKGVSEVKREKGNVELAAPKRPTAEAAAAAVQYLLGSESEEHIRRRAEQALEGYDRWRGSSRRAAPTT
ncbi:hypothetical protein QYE76_028302 [Lolium multiflorum]|uniref:Transposase (putative) gypsy type domain-containing protein n=1 Tax=Lolium multiflorum TaxID=4521 RepID=A0AAD8QME4_LOLMU|nr:hypothetical protein QYE76_028302 [Lolium multiflorum]